MAGVEAISSQSLYFAAAQAAAKEQARGTQKKQQTGTVKKSSFASSVEKAQEKLELESSGLPVELAGMEMEEAVIFLKDELDIAGDQLAENPDMNNMENYRKKLGNFMKYVSKNNYEVLTQVRKKKGLPLIDPKTKKPAYYVQIQVINEKIAQLTSDLLYNHRGNLNVLARVNELNGLIVDLLAA